MEISAFVDTCPFLFHTTALANIERIARERQLLSAARLSARSSVPLRLTERRDTSVLLPLEDGSVVIRDHGPLAVGNIQFEPNWDRARFIELLNGLVFFWPGRSPAEPIEHGLRHADHYLQAGEKLAFLRIRSEEMVLGEALFAAVNSGAPRMANGLRGSRGAGTFVRALAFRGAPANVVEVAFRGAVKLPPETVWSTDRVSWQAL